LEVSRVGFYVYKCLVCGELVGDPKEHTLKTGHTKGYKKIYVSTDE